MSEVPVPVTKQPVPPVQPQQHERVSSGDRLIRQVERHLSSPNAAVVPIINLNVPVKVQDEAVKAFMEDRPQDAPPGSTNQLRVAVVTNPKEGVIAGLSLIDDDLISIAIRDDNFVAADVSQTETSTHEVISQNLSVPGQVVSISLIRRKDGSVDINARKYRYPIVEGDENRWNNGSWRHRMSVSDPNFPVTEYDLTRYANAFENATVDTVLTNKTAQQENPYYTPPPKELKEMDATTIVESTQ